MPASIPRPLLWPNLLRAGAFGALYGGHPGDPALGLTVAVDSRKYLQMALELLADQNTNATLLVVPDLARSSPDLLWQAAQAGHEIAGLGEPRDLTWLEVAVGQQIQHWALDGAALNRPHLQQLAVWGIHPLPLPLDEPEPGGTLRAWPPELPGLLPELKSLGYRPQPVRDLPELRQATPRDLFRYAYGRLMEDPYARREGMLELSQRFDSVMRVAPLKHAPDPLPLPPDTPTAELHLKSVRLVGLASRQWLGTYRAYQRGLKDVAKAMQERPELQEAQAVFGVSQFYGPLEKSGFRVLELPPLRARWYALGFRILRLAYGTTKASSAGLPKMAWMSREEFLQKYGS